MEDTWNYYYALVKRLLSFVGQWPYQERRMRLFQMSLLTAITVSLIVPQMGKYIQCGGDVQCIMVTIPSTMVMIMLLVKLYTCQFNSSKIKNLFDRLRSDWEELECAEEYEIMKTYAAKARLFSLLYSRVGIFVAFSIISPILNVVLPLNESRPIFMPYEAYYFVDGEKYFFYIFFHVIVSLEIAITTVVAHDCLLLVYIEHVCSVFTAAGFRFETVSRNDRDDKINNSQDVYDRKIAKSVYTHWRALRRFAELLENTFYISFAVQILIVTVSLSISLLQIVLQLDELMEAARYAGFVISQLFHLFCFSIQGQKLSDHSVQMRDRIYNSSWYDIPAKSQRLLLYVMRRSMQPNFLSAGKIYVFSLKSFTTVVQSSVSYFTVLASFQF